MECEDYHEYDPIIAYEDHVMCTMSEIINFLAASSDTNCMGLPLDWKDGKWSDQEWCSCHNSADVSAHDKLTCHVHDKLMSDWKLYCSALGNQFNFS